MKQHTSYCTEKRKYFSKTLKDHPKIFGKKQKPMPTRQTFKTLFTLYLTAILVVTLVPLSGLTTALNNITVVSLRADYLLHAVAFAPLFPIWRWRWPAHGRLTSLLACLLIAAATEAAQYLLPYRSFNINDLIANVAGVAIAAALWLALRR